MRLAWRLSSPNIQVCDIFAPKIHYLIFVFCVERLKRINPVTGVQSFSVLYWLTSASFIIGAVPLLGLKPCKSFPWVAGPEPFTFWMSELTFTTTSSWPIHINSSCLGSSSTDHQSSLRRTDKKGAHHPPGCSKEIPLEWSWWFDSWQWQMHLENTWRDRCVMWRLLYKTRHGSSHRNTRRKQHQDPPTPRPHWSNSKRWLRTLPRLLRMSNGWTKFRQPPSPKHSRAPITEQLTVGMLLHTLHQVWWW